MNYIKHYSKLIRKASDRCLSGYKERHHVFPKSIFGKNLFLVELTAREHYIAHLMLYKICKKRYGLFDIKTNKMMFAVSRMKNRNIIFNSRLYESIRSKIIHSEETKLKISIKGKGRVPWNKGKVGVQTQTIDQIRKRSEKNIGKHWWTDGETEFFGFVPPDDSWVLGRLSNLCWWTDGKSNKRGYFPPDSSWIRGRTISWKIYKNI